MFRARGHSPLPCAWLLCYRVKYEHDYSGSWIVVVDEYDLDLQKTESIESRSPMRARYRLRAYVKEAALLACSCDAREQSLACSCDARLFPRVLVRGEGCSLAYSCDERTALSRACVTRESLSRAREERSVFSARLLRYFERSGWKLLCHSGGSGISPPVTMALTTRRWTTRQATALPTAMPRAIFAKVRMESPILGE